MFGFSPFVAFAQEADRAQKTSFKGVELYSWKDGPSGSWKFSLLPGTNRVKTSVEIKDSRRTISGVKLLKERIASLPEGEEVYWFVISSDTELSYPEAAIVKEIVEFAVVRKIEVVVKH
jgi:hypothetical protein